MQKCANVISADFRILAQLKAGDKQHFEKVSIQPLQHGGSLAQRATLNCLRSAIDR